MLDSMIMVQTLRRFALLAAVLGGVLPATAQQRARTLPSGSAPKPPASERVGQLPMGVIDGLVTDSALTPLGGAEIGILRTPVKITTNARGRFRITDVQMGTYILILRRFGYSPIASVVSVGANDTLRTTYTLRRLGIGKLDTVRVTERRESRHMMEFERRRQLGLGHFLTAREIERRGSIDVGTLLRTFSELAVVRNDATGVTSLQNRRDQGNMLTATGAGACATQVIVDNVPMPAEVDVEMLPRPKEIAGIEVYAGPSGVPAQFSGTNRQCGTVIIWTKDGRVR